MTPAELRAVQEHREPAVVGQEAVMPDDPRWEMAMMVLDMEHSLRLAERDLRGKRALISKLRRRNQDEAEMARKAHPDRELFERIFDRWRVESGHVNCRFTPERFDMTAARYAEGYGEDVLSMAVVGVATNPYVIEGERKDDYKTAMRSGEQVERYANRCDPAVRREIRAELGGTLFEVAT